MRSNQIMIALYLLRYTFSKHKIWQSITFRWNEVKRETILLTIGLSVLLIGASFAFPLWYVLKTNVLIGLALFPYVLLCNYKQRFNFLYLSCLILFGFIAFYYHVRIFYFFSLSFFVLFLIELWVGKPNRLALFLLAFMSPFFQQVAVILGFPIRLQLSSWAGHILSVFGINIKVEGNMMLLNGAQFSVDDACMGLNMLAFSMLMGVFALAHQYRIQKVRLSFSNVFIFFSGLFLLNLLANLLRIMLLVLFKVTPENPMHEVCGLLCVSIYVMTPMYFLSKWFVKRFGKQIISVSGKFNLSYIQTSFVFLLVTLVCFVGVYIKMEKEHSSVIPHANVNLPGFQIDYMNDGITKLTNEDALVYVKPIPEFFTGEHTPLLCWKGSGYNFEGVSKTKVSGHEIYIGQLTKPGQTLFTAWWYSNGKVQTVNQFDWRLRMLKGEERFCLINITATNSAALKENLECIFNQQFLAQN
jgi:exosortase N